MPNLEHAIRERAYHLWPARWTAAILAGGGVAADLCIAVNVNSAQSA